MGSPVVGCQLWPSVADNCCTCLLELLKHMQLLGLWVSHKKWDGVASPRKLKAGWRSSTRGLGTV